MKYNIFKLFEIAYLLKTNQALPKDIDLSDVFWEIGNYLKNHQQKESVPTFDYKDDLSFDENDYEALKSKVARYADVLEQILPLACAYAATLKEEGDSRLIIDGEDNTLPEILEAQSLLQNQEKAPIAKGLDLKDVDISEFIDEEAPGKENREKGPGDTLESAIIYCASLIESRKAQTIAGLSINSEIELQYKEALKIIKERMG